MDSNKDESEKCINIAIQAMKCGNKDKAEKFLLKAERLFPSNKAKELLNTLSSFTFDDGQNQRESAPRKRNVNKENHKPDESKLNVDYTPEQAEIVKKIQKCKDYYEVLGVTKESSDSEIKKSYKKLALLLHPDKNRAPGAVEAFKAVGNAVAVLTDPQKRKAYDLYGSEQITSNYRSKSSSHNASSYEYAYSRGFESDVTAEELFNIFFGGGFTNHRHTERHRPRFSNFEYQQHNSNQNGQPSLAFILILLFTVVSVLSTFFTSDPLYSLQPSSKYSVERKTLTYKIPYYVQKNFDNEYQGSIGRLENSVEEEFIATMKRACHNEKNYREAMMARAKSFGSKSQYAQAQQLKTTSCDVLYRLGVGRVTYRD
uniref:J domain-containing protein n=1 Tax=Corethrella appendiculata TaxID=1370023 RepID=U5EXV9_9DIPT